MKKRLFLLISYLFLLTSVMAVGRSGMYQYSVSLTGFVSEETGKTPTAYLWIPEGCRQVKAVMLAQQNFSTANESAGHRVSMGSSLVLSQLGTINRLPTDLRGDDGGAGWTKWT